MLLKLYSENFNHYTKLFVETKSTNLFYVSEILCGNYMYWRNSGKLYFKFLEEWLSKLANKEVNEQIQL